MKEDSLNGRVRGNDCEASKEEDLKVCWEFFMRRLVLIFEGNYEDWLWGVPWCMGPHYYFVSIFVFILCFLFLENLRITFSAIQAIVHFPLLLYTYLCP